MKTSLSSVLAAMMFAPVPAALANPGDVSVAPFNCGRVACAGCAGGSGVKLCFDVTVAANAQSAQDGEDFHFLVADAQPANFQCATVEKLIVDPTGVQPPRWETRMNHWNAGSHSQNERQADGTVQNKHYMSWYAKRNSEGAPRDGISSGDSYRFCFVYCGEFTPDGVCTWILTDSANTTPGLPDENGNRPDVPDQGGHDDPGWSGAASMAPPPCAADVDDGSGTGIPDGGVTIDDLLFYLIQFSDGALLADVDDGSGLGLPDGGITIDDVLYFLTRFASGC